MLLPSRLEYPLSSEHISCRVALWSQIGIRLLLYWLWSQNRLMELDLRDVLNWNILQSIAFRSGPVAPWHWEPVSRTPGSLSARSAADPGPCFLVPCHVGLCVFDILFTERRQFPCHHHSFYVPTRSDCLWCPGLNPESTPLHVSLGGCFDVWDVPVCGQPFWAAWHELY